MNESVSKKTEEETIESWEDWEEKAVKPEKNETSHEPIEIQQREKVKEAMIHAWSSYEKYAWSQDELQVRRRFLKYNLIQLLHMDVHKLKA